MASVFWNGTARGWPSHGWMTSVALASPNCWPEQHQPSCGVANTRQVVGGARREHPYLAPPDSCARPKRRESPRLVEDNYLEELVRMRPIADNNVVLIEALHLGATRDGERGRYGSLVFRRLSATSHGTLAGVTPSAVYLLRHSASWSPDWLLARLNGTG